MEVLQIINKYYADNDRLRDILMSHSHDVATMAIDVAIRHRELDIDRTFLYEAAMLHDIGVFLTNAPDIECHGTEPYIRHGILGGRLLREAGFPRHARVAERHTGTGITEEVIRRQNLPLPLGDYSPETMEEVLVCYADKFFSKTRLHQQKSPEQVLRSLEKFGQESVSRMLRWMELFP